MKNMYKVFGTIVMAVTIVFFASGCDADPDPLDESSPGKSADNPIVVELEGITFSTKDTALPPGVVGWGEIFTGLKNKYDHKFITVDLSNCNAYQNTISGFSNPSAPNDPNDLVDNAMNSEPLSKLNK